MTCGEVKVSSAPEAPVGEVFGGGSGVADFDELEIFFRGAGWEIHDLGDDDRSYLRIRVQSAKGLAVHADEAALTSTIGMTAERFAIKGGGEIDFVDELEGCS